MLRKFRKNVARTHALRLDPPSVAQGGLAFLIAYAIAYVFQAA
jgi:hypothetical protein